jgi:hypothetical protein
MYTVNFDSFQVPHPQDLIFFRAHIFMWATVSSVSMKFYIVFQNLRITAPQHLSLALADWSLHYSEFRFLTGDSTSLYSEWQQQ